MNRISIAAAVLLAIFTAPPTTLIAQGKADSARAPSDTTHPVAAATVPSPSLPFDFSGVVFARFIYGGPRTGNTRLANRFDVERAYLTFRAPAGEHVSIRVTADVYQRGDTTASTYYRGWALRAKYAYVQYDYLRGVGDALKANVRLGLLHTPVIDYEEQFWPRGIAPTALEQNGYFASSDVGAATTVSFPNKIGELYAAIVNGSGYTSPETDRFKDYSARLSLTPFSKGYGILRTFNLSPWYYEGTAASRFDRTTNALVTGGEARRKDRYGIHAGIRDPRITLAAQVARNVDESTDSLTVAAPSVVERRGTLVSAYTLVKPFAFMQSAPSWPLVALFRYDEYKPNTTQAAYQRFWVAGLGWELSKKASAFLDYQSQEPHSGSKSADLKTYYLHVIANF